MSGGRLTSGTGVAVHAASFLHQRLVILDRELLANPIELKRIWLHELLHFVWWRMSNRKRRSWELVLLSERCRGELGWSAEWRKRKLTMADRENRTRKWREYCSESFCDTGASIYIGSGNNPEATLPPRAMMARTGWWNEYIRYTSI